MAESGTRASDAGPAPEPSGDEANLAVRIERLFDLAIRLRGQVEAPGDFRGPLAGRGLKLPLASLPRHPALEVTELLRSALERSGPRSPESIAEAAEAWDRRNVDRWYSPEPMPFGQDRTLLRVRYPKVEAVPEPPQAVAERLLAGWRDPNSEPALAWPVGGVPQDSSARSSGWLARRRDRQAAESGGEGLDLQTDQWLARWRAWAAKERVAGKVRQTFEALLDLYLESGAAREIVLVDGIFAWPQRGLKSPIPLVEQRVVLSYSGAEPTAVIKEDTTPPVFNTHILREVAGLSAARVAEIEAEFRELGYHPLQGGPTTRFFHRLLLEIDAGGELLFARVDRHVDRSIWPQDRPVIERNPTLIERSVRPSGRSLEQISSRISSRLRAHAEEIRSLPLFDLVSETRGVRATEPPPDRQEESRRPPGDAKRQDFLLAEAELTAEEPEPSPETEDVLVLADSLRDEDCRKKVLEWVEVGLAAGRSVLVTGRDAASLKQFEQELGEEFRPLCLSVGTGEGTPRQGLERAVESIVDRLATVDPRRLEFEANQLEHERARILAKLQDAREQFESLRNAEAEPLRIGKLGFLPEEAGRFVANHRAELDWIPGPLEVGAALPVSAEEVAALYETQASLSLEHEELLRQSLPSLERLPVPPIVRSLFETHRLLTDKIRENYDRALSAAPTAADLFEKPARRHEGVGVAREARRLRRLVAGLERRARRKPWLIPILEISLDDHSSRSWFAMLEWIVELRTMALRCRESIAAAQPMLADDLTPEDQAVLAREIEQHLRRTGRSFGQFERFLHRDWSRLARRVKVRGEHARTAAEWKAIADLASLEAERRRIVRQWRRLAVPVGLPDVERPSSVEVELEPWVRTLQSLLRLPGQWLPRLRRRLTPAGIDRTALERLLRHGEPPLSSGIRFIETPMPDGSTSLGSASPGPGVILSLRLEALASALEARCAECELAFVHESEENFLAAMKLLTPRSAPVVELQRHFELRNADGYSKVYESLRDASELEPLFQARELLLERIERVAPDWAEALRHRSGYHGLPTVPSDPERAWRWRQFVEEFERRSEISLDGVARRIRELEADLARVSSTLAGQRAWANQIRRTSLEHHRALLSWRELMMQLQAAPLASAKHARLKRDAARLMRECQSAVPAWVVPLDRVESTFDMQPGAFDLVVIDGADQIGLNALGTVSLGRRLVLAPSDGRPLDQAGEGRSERDETAAASARANLLRFLRDPESKTPSYESRSLDRVRDVSLLQAFAHDSLVLVDPRRPRQCVSELATLIDLLTRQLPDVVESEVPVLQPMESHRYGEPLVAVPIEDQEAVADGVASVLAAALNRSEYQSVDVAVLVENSSMLDKIERKLKANLAPDRYLDSRLTVVNLAAERDREASRGRQFDVVVLAVGPDQGRLTDWSTSSTTADALARTLVLAAARTRHQLIVVHALAGDFPSSDPRGLLVDGFSEIERLAAADDQVGSLSERIAAELEQIGFDVRWRGPIPGAERRRFLSVAGPARSVAIDCADDPAMGDSVMEQLRGLGWPVLRVPPGQFLNNRQSTMARLVEELALLGITPATAVRARTEARRLVSEARQLRDSWRRSGARVLRSTVA